MKVEFELRFAFLTPPSLASKAHTHSAHTLPTPARVCGAYLCLACLIRATCHRRICARMGDMASGVWVYRQQRYRYRINLFLTACIGCQVGSSDLHTHLRLEGCVTWRRLLGLLALLLLHLRSIESQPSPEAKELDADQGENESHEQHGRGQRGANDSRRLTYKR